MNSDIDLHSIKTSEAEFAVFDFETTGTSARYNRVIEIGIVKIKKNKIIDTYQSFINPGLQISPFITQLTGISNEELHGAPFFEEVYEKILNIFGDSVIAAHNLKFDYSFLKAEVERAALIMPDNESVCTLRLARKLYPNLKSKSLGALTKHFRIRHRGVHRALGDATATAKLLIKMMSYAKTDHHVETVDELINLQSNRLTTKKIKFIKKKLIDDYNRLPDSPGIYIFKDKNDRVIYIGKAKALKRRVRNYFTDRSTSKTRKIVKLSSKINFKETNTELVALLAEAQMIKTENPPINVMLKGYSNNYFIRLKKSESYPIPEIIGEFDFDGNDYFGPYSKRDTAKEILEIIYKSFTLRECSNKEFAKKKRCYLADIERCKAPCVDEISSEEYNIEIQNLYEFLQGNNQKILNRMIYKMKEYSDRAKYEQAAEYRDIINRILDQLHRAAVIREPINKTNTIIEIKGSRNNDYIYIREGKVIIRNYLFEEPIKFDDAVNDYYNGNIRLFSNFDNRELERTKIVLSWIVRNKEKVRTFYLSDFDSKSELFRQMSII